MNRRGFLSGILAAAAAPAIVRADSLMRVVPRGPVALFLDVERWLAGGGESYTVRTGWMVDDATRLLLREGGLISVAAGARPEQAVVNVLAGARLKWVAPSGVRAVEIACSGGGGGGRG